MLQARLERYVHELEKEKRELLAQSAELRISLAEKDSMIRQLLIKLALKIDK